MLGRLNMRDAQQAAFGFLVAQTSYIEPIVYRTQYPDIQYPMLIPVDTAAPEWTKSITFYSSDQTGKADWFSHLAKDMPLADVSRERFESGVEMAGIGYFYTLEELGQAMMIPGTNLTTDRASAARRAYEEFVDACAFTGNTAKGFDGLVNYPGVGITVVAADGTGTSTLWSTKSADQILRDINNALLGMFTETNTVEMADTILLPLGAMAALSKIMPNSTMTVLAWIQANNVLTMTTGQPLTIRAIRGLDTVGTSGQGRMIVYKRDPAVLKMHIPMPHRFLPVWQTGPLRFDVPGIFRLGGLEIRRPKAVRYVDNISVSPT